MSPVRLTSHRCTEKNCQKLLSKEKGIFYFENFFVFTTKLWFFNKNLSRKSIVSIHRIRCGHTSLNSSLFKHKIVDSDICKCDDSVDNVEHIFWECILYEKERKTMLKDIRKVIKVDPLSIINLLSTTETNMLNAICNFIESIKCNI